MVADMRALVGAAILAAGLVVSAAPASAKIDCAHRGYEHIDRHGGKLEDDRFHLMHHELPTCDHDKHEGKADDEPEEAWHDAEHAEHDLEHGEKDLKRFEPHHRDKIGPHRDHHLF